MHNGQGVWWVSADTFVYQQEALIQLEYLKNSNWTGWFTSFNNHINVKIVSLSYWIFGTNNPISLSFTNALIWVFSIILIFKSSKLIFPKNTFVPFFTIFFFFQPSILFQSTQMLRDPYLIFGICCFIYSWIILENNHSKWKWLFYMLLGFIFTTSMRLYLFPIFVLPTLAYMAWVLYYKRWMFSPFVILLVLLGSFQLIYDNNYGQINIDQKLTSMKSQLNPQEILDQKLEIEILNGHLNFGMMAAKQKLEFEKNKLKLQEIIEEGLVQQNNLERKAFEQQKIYEKNLAKIQTLDQNIYEEEILILKKAIVLYQKNLLVNESARLKKTLSILNQKVLMEAEEERLKANWAYMSELETIIPQPNVIPSESLIMNILNVYSHHIGSIRYDFQRAVSPSEVYLLYQAEIEAPGSSMDSHILIYDFNTLIKYFPRALQVGFFAPFPIEWFQERRAVGRIGSILSGIEMFIWYFILVGFSYALFYNYAVFRQLLPVLFFSIVIIVLLSYVVPVLGTLFRLRQGYMLPFFIFGTYGLAMIFNRFSTKF